MSAKPTKVKDKAPAVKSKNIIWTNHKIKLGDLKAWDKNPVKISKREKEELLKSLKKFGRVLPYIAATPIVGGKADLLDGHQRQTVEFESEVDPNTSVDVRVPSRKLTEDEKKELVVRLRKNTGEFDSVKLTTFFDPAQLINWGFKNPELKAHGFEIAAAPATDSPVEDKKGELLKKWGVEFGDLWQVGNHRLICADSTNEKSIARLLDGAKVDLMLGDPPYCSGGFQEAGKKSGSIGTRGNETIENDTLSTRGYMALMKGVFNCANVGVAYIFTDWRMWINLFDVVESSGYGVRNMIVWDKGTPGMGRGWRSQHELIMAAMKVTQPFDPKKAQGNVIQVKRTGNINHPTEKPIELMTKILEVNDLAKTNIDPFAGSGVVMAASENVGMKNYSVEKTPAFCAVTLERMASAFGIQPVLIERINGKKK